MSKRKHKLSFYEDGKGEHRWRIQASNGKIVAESGEGYKRKSAAVKSISNLLENVKTNHYEVID